MNHQFDREKKLARLIAQRETFRNLTKQLRGLKWRLDVLNGVTADTAGSSNNHHHHPNSRAFILRKLKYALRTQYEDWFPRFLPPDLCTVLLLFDIDEEPFFHINPTPKKWPEGWPTGLDLGSAEGIEVELLSGAIYKKVLEAFREEEEGDGMVVEEPPRTLGMVSNSGSSGGPWSSVVEENGLRRVIVKSEEEEIVIDDEEEEEAAENNVHANEQVNRRASTDGHQETEEEDRMNYQSMFHGEDLADSASSDAAAAASSSSSSSSAIVPPENGSPVVNPQTDADADINNSISSNNTTEQEQRQTSVSSGSTVNRRQSEPAGTSSTVTITVTKVGLPPKRDLRMAPEEAPAAASVAVPPPPAAAANPKRAKVSVVSSPLVSRPSAAAAAADKRRAGATASTTTSTPSAASTSQQQQQQHQQHRPSTSTPIALADVTAANVEDYLRANCPSYFLVKNAHTKVDCPVCKKPLTKYQLKDHLLAVHRRLKPYHCQGPDCSFTTGWKNSAAAHVKDVHKGRYAQYIVYRF